MARALFALLLLAATAPAAAQDATTPGAVTTPHPTLEQLSIEWAFSGDADADGVVRVRFREAGAGPYRDAMNLLRVPGGANEGFSWATRHAGSLFALRPATSYEIELSLDDPDGGSETRTVMASTRPVPALADGAPIVTATPADVEARIAAASPGTVILLGPGTYSSITVTVDGAAGSPIVVRGTSAPEVIVDGAVRMDGRSHVWIENLTVREQIKFNDSDHIVVRGCLVQARQATGDGIVAYGGGTSDGYFADNTVTGQSTWTEAAFGVSGTNLGEGIVMTGPGNVIEHNRVSGFRDCISLLEDGEAMNQVSIDILRNDLDVCVDDAIEADFAMGNVRVIQNRMVNSFIALSSQPSLGGPTYFIRNVSFGNVFQVFKPNRGSIGDLWLHNTVVKPGDALGVYAGREWSRAIFRNNLFLGGTGGGDYNGFNNGSGRVLQAADADEASCDFDYDGYGSIGTGTFEGRFGATRFMSLAELRSMTSEGHAVSVDLGIFAASFAFPDTPLTATTVPDLRLAAGSNAIDVGEVLPNVNDGFAGAGPDLGAFELGAPVPSYGPRGPALCGNGMLEGAESCDDGNTVSGDGCSSSCVSEVFDDGGGIVPRDGGSMGTDAASGGDAGPGGGGGGGCGCHTSGRSGAPNWLLLALIGLLLYRRRGTRVPGRTRSVSLGAAVLSLLATMGCGGGSIGTPCASPGDCGAGNVCVDGRCRPSSAGDASADASNADSGALDASHDASPRDASLPPTDAAADTGVDASCGGEAVDFDYRPPNVLVIFDRSCSMRRRLDDFSLFGTGPDDPLTRWYVAREAVQSLVTDFERRVYWGLMAFPDPREGCGMPVDAEVVPGPMNAAAIQTELSRHAIQPFGLCGLDNTDTTTQPRQTPTADALTSAMGLPALSDPTRRSFAILVTDGGVSCGVSNAEVSALAASLAAADIPVGVVGFATGAAESSLEAIASAGGFPNPAGPPSYFVAESRADLDAIFAELSRRVVSCDLPLSSSPMDGAGVFVNANDIPLREDVSDGFSYDAAGNVVTLHGTSCDRLRSGDITRLDISFGCPPVMCVPRAETCNGLDDDCDGVVDNACLT